MSARTERCPVAESRDLALALLGKAEAVLRAMNDGSIQPTSSFVTALERMIARAGRLLAVGEEWQRS